jgi:hypothetical protein
MSNINQQFETGKPAVSMKWSKDTVVETFVVKNSIGRFVCHVKVNGNEFTLPSTHPTAQDAQLTLVAYIQENSST